MKLIKKAIKLAKEKIEKKNYKEAELICSQILKIEEKNIEALGILCVCKYNLSKKEEFNKYLQKILEIDPNNFDSNNSLGLSFLYLENLKESEKYFKKAIKIEPKNFSAWSNLGCQLRLQKNKESIKVLEKAKKLSKKKDAQTLVNLAGAYAENLQIEKSISNLKQAIKINPKSHSAHVDLAHAYFLKGNYKKGWIHYEYRQCKNSIINNLNKNKKWKGSCIKDGKTILFFCEQGIGDSINFIRFIKDFKKENPKVVVKTLVPDCLYGLFSKNFEGIIKNIESHDYWCSIVDIPKNLNIKNEKIKENFRPYIKQTKECDYSSFKHLYKIGICWAGNAQHPRDSERSCYLSHLKEICNIQNTKTFSLQKDLRKRIWPFNKEPVDLSYCPGIKMINMSNYINSWEDTASIISGLDLVVSVDTSILHLSGAMGKKTFGMICKFPDWRWGLDSEDTFWYPSVKLFRQKNYNDWYSVAYEIKKEINMNI